MKLIAFLSLFLASLLALPAQAQDRPAYAPGQVWEYKNRPRDAGSLLRIQQVEQGRSGEPVYHISVIGFRIGPESVNEIGHLPVSRATLDASVVRLSTSTAEFPDPAEGIRQWREARGGVFDLPVAEILGIIEKGIIEQQPAN